jgi:hypothetical protein
VIAYQHTVESTVYLAPDNTGQGLGRQSHRAVPASQLGPFDNSAPFQARNGAEELGAYGYGNATNPSVLPLASV